MMHDSCYIARGARGGNKFSKLRAHDEPRNRDSKRYWRSYAMSAER